jgi:hypothetical protein
MYMKFTRKGLIMPVRLSVFLSVPMFEQESRSTDLITICECEVWQIKGGKKSYWVLKRTFGADQQENLEERRLEMK